MKEIKIKETGVMEEVLYNQVMILKQLYTMTKMEVVNTLPNY